MTRYAIFAEGCSADPSNGKTAHGLIRYRADAVACVIDAHRAGTELLGTPVVGTLEEALAHSPTAVVIGVAPPGGQLPPSWRPLILAAIEAGLAVESGLHERLADDPELAAAARRRGVALHDLRRPPAGLGVPTGANLTHAATVVHTVGSDCAIGKKTVALELDRAARARGLRSVFVPTGQTGVAIAGWGLAIDAVVADFVAGAAEHLVVEGARRGDLLWVEGQGALLHPFYSGVTLGLYHGCAPHVLVLCHFAGRTELEDAPGHRIPALAELVALYEQIALPARPARVAAVALNTSALDASAARQAIAAAADETGLPAGDPVRFGANELVAAVLSTGAPRAAAG